MSDEQTTDAGEVEAMPEAIEAVPATAEPEVVPEAAVELAAEATREPEVEPTPMPATGPDTLLEAEPAAEPPESALPEAELVSEAAAGPDVEAEPEPVAVVATGAAAPAVSDGLVPLTDLAPAIVAVSVSRRRFLGFGLAIAGGLAGAAVLGRLFPVFEEGAPPPLVPTYDPASKAWTFVIDTEACIGCGLCVAACKEENHVPEEPTLTRTWVERHTTTADGAFYVDSPEGGIHGFPPSSTAPGAEGKAVTEAYFEPRLCMQCENSPCTVVCPVSATYRTVDGVILVDARRCIGCGYCVVACPYGARYIVPAGEDAPNGTPGVADKCTWCYHRISRNRLPACVEVCPVGARRFGDANDPASGFATLVRERRPEMLHPEYGTRPRVLYLGPSVREA
jgi:tetrathionate reductase subunit B